MYPSFFSKESQWAYKAWFEEIHFIAHSRQIHLFTYYQESVLTPGGFVLYAKEKQNKIKSLHVLTP